MTLAFSHHDHQNCQSEQLKNVGAICLERGLRFTPMRERVLTMLLKSHSALGAYELLSELAREGEPAQPPIVYRALAFLTQNGFAHKVERLNAYVACHFPNHAHNAGFMICKECKQIGETCIDISPFAHAGFMIESEVIEAVGLCQNCSGQEAK